MEAEGAKILYQRSVQLRKLRYIPYIGDGDSKAYSAVCQEQPYGAAVFIPKEECVAHVTKRMGTGLRKLVTDYKGKYGLHIYCMVNHEKTLHDYFILCHRKYSAQWEGWV